MAQGSKKQKAKTPAIKQKANKAKGSKFNRRGNAPIAPKKAAFVESQKLQAMVSKTVNKKIEVEMRSRATEGKVNISKAQEAVAKYHKKMNESDTASQSTLT